MMDKELKQIMDDFFINQYGKFCQHGMKFDDYLFKKYLRQEFIPKYNHAYDVSYQRNALGEIKGVRRHTDGPNKDDKVLFGMVERNIIYCAQFGNPYSSSSNDYSSFMQSFMMEAVNRIHIAFTSYIAGLDAGNDYNAQEYERMEEELKKRGIQMAADTISLLIGKLIECLKDVRNPQMLADLKSLNTGTQREFIKVENKGILNRLTSAYNRGSANYHHVQQQAGKVGGAVLGVGESFVHSKVEGAGLETAGFSGINPLEDAVVSSVNKYLTKEDLGWINKCYIFFSVTSTSSLMFIPGAPLFAGIWAKFNEFKTIDDVGKWLFSLITSIPGLIGVVINIVNIILNFFFSMITSHNMTLTRLTMRIYPGKRRELKEKMDKTQQVLLFSNSDAQLEIIANAIPFDTYSKIMGIGTYSGGIR